MNISGYLQYYDYGHLDVIQCQLVDAENVLRNQLPPPSG